MGAVVCVSLQLHSVERLFNFDGVVNILSKTNITVTKYGDYM